ncbi:N-acetylmuramoyl-L-alanine amidase [Aquibacillus kalidii]|uniref:N-acetylmuramoyl-L-alanine amidase n=1 Tax=Aquibacillus kalidii TaxID=2762597 RepID=UPI001C997EA8|nr:N-acetylmuramoyl-L-alanine amidase [Aquibacillus kalidii]
MNKSLFTFLFLGITIVILSITTIVYASEAIINVNNLNVRNGPGTEFDTISQVNQEDYFQVLRVQGDWVEIELDNSTTGWIAKQFVTLEEAKEEEDQLNTIKDEEPVKNDSSGATNQEALQNDLTLDLRHDNNGVKSKVIVIDPGHGGRDVGAIGISGSFEKDHTLKTALVLKSYLELLGAEVILTRDSDQYLSLSGRASVANNKMADLFISIHYNSTPQYPTASGVSTYYYSERDKLLAETIQQEILVSTSMEDRGIHQESYQVTRMNHRPSLLLELGFLSNPEQEENIQSNVFQSKLAQGIISGIEHYFR